MNHGNLTIKDTKIIAFVVEDKYRLLRHIALCLVFFSIVFFSDWLKGYSGADKYYRFASVFGIFITLFYINIYILVPTLFFKGKYLLYLIILVVMVKFGIELMSWLMSVLIQAREISIARTKPDEYKSFYEGTVIAVPFILITTTIKLLQRWVKDNQSIDELKNLTLSMELNELKNQINPHFLFNMLNGIKALIRTDPEKATTVIMKLSSFLRYQLYENNDEKTMLDHELNFLSNFLSLETLRRDNLSTNISYTTDPTLLKGIMLPPNLFTTFVENAVKHSINITGEHSYIDISIGLNNNKLIFACSNSVDVRFASSDKHRGLGLANIKRRLELLYGENHTLAVDAATQTYTVKLIIPV